MAGKTFVIICSLLFVQIALARVARDAPAEPNPVTDLVSELTKIGLSLKEFADKSMQDIKDSDAAKQLKQTVDTTLNNLKKENPEVAKNIETLNISTKKIIEEVSKFGDSESAKQIQELGNKVLGTTIEALKDVNNKIQESAKSQ